MTNSMTNKEIMQGNLLMMYRKEEKKEEQQISEIKI